MLKPGHKSKLKIKIQVFILLYHQFQSLKVSVENQLEIILNKESNLICGCFLLNSHKPVYVNTLLLNCNKQQLRIETSGCLSVILQDYLKATQKNS